MVWKAVMDSLNLNLSVIIGHSMGGYVTPAFADLFPETSVDFAFITALRIRTAKKKTRPFAGHSISEGK